MNQKVILLVEDNPDDVALALRAFKHSNIDAKIVVAENGVEALDYLFHKGNYENRNPKLFPQLVLLDLKLPKLDGLEVLRQMQESDATKILPVVVLTSSTEEDDIVASYQLGANSYIRKPVDFRQFTHSIKQLEIYWLSLNEVPLQGRIG